MADQREVKLHGMWGSPYVKRVELALKVKGIAYDYTEEDLRNKSQLLLQYNPVHKRVPVLIHDGKTIAESLVILEYIDETWTNAPKLLPEDPYKRAQVRLWASFLDQQMFEHIRHLIRCEGEVQEKAIKQISEELKVLEENMEEIFLGGSPSNLNLLDMVMAPTMNANVAVELALGVKLVDQERYPLVYSWIAALSELPVVKDTVAPPAKLAVLFQAAR